MSMYFKPDGSPLALEEWAQAYEGKRHVADTRVGRYRISTVYMGLNHQYDPTLPPLIYETMVFDQSPKANKWEELDMRRYSTYAQAREGHYALVAQYSKRGRKVVEYDEDLMEEVQP